MRTYKEKTFWTLLLSGLPLGDGYEITEVEGNVGDAMVDEPPVIYKGSGAH